MNINNTDTIKAYLTFSQIKGLYLRHKSNTTAEFPKSITCTICHSYKHCRLLSKPLQCTTFTSKPFEFYAYDYIPLKLWRYQKELINPQRIYLTISLMTHDKAMLVGSVTIIVRGDGDIQNSSEWNLLDIEKIQRRGIFGRGKDNFGWKEYPDWKFNWSLGKVSWKIHGGYNKLTKSLSLGDVQKNKINTRQINIIKKKSQKSTTKEDILLPSVEEKIKKEKKISPYLIMEEEDIDISPQKSLTSGFNSHSYTYHVDDGISDISSYSNRRKIVVKKSDVTTKPRSQNDCTQPYKNIFQCIIDPLHESELFNKERLKEMKEKKRDHYKSHNIEKNVLKPPDVISFRQFEQSYSGITSSRGTTRSSINSARNREAIQEQINQEAKKLAKKYKEIYEGQLKKERKKIEESKRKGEGKFGNDNTSWAPKTDVFCGITNTY